MQVIFELAIISGLFLIAGIHLTANSINLKMNEQFFSLTEQMPFVNLKNP